MQENAYQSVDSVCLVQMLIAHNMHPKIINVIDIILTVY